MGKLATPLRFLASGLVAGAVLLFGGGWIVHHYLGHHPEQTVGLTVVNNVKLLAHVPGTDKQTKDKSADKAAPQREVPGFAQVAFTVGADGRAHDIHVLRSVPEGVYDQAARAVIAARHFKPSKSAHGAEQTEIVHFQVPASALKKGANDAGSGGR
ncbi:MAG: energy transducer TonB [Gammaproteobacteria bacterium]